MDGLDNFGWTWPASNAVGTKIDLVTVTFLVFARAKITKDGGYY